MRTTFLSLLLLVIGMLNVMADAIPAANHNLGCTGSTDINASADASNVFTILPAGSRTTASVANNGLQAWGNITVNDAVNDDKGHALYNFTSSGSDYSATGGFLFSSAVGASQYKYLHIAVYLTEPTTIQIRMVTAGGVDGTWSQYQVNSSDKSLGAGWNYLNIPLTVDKVDREVKSNSSSAEFAYWSCGNTFNFNLSQVSQIGFVVKEQSHTVYVDDMYLYNSQDWTTYDYDNEGIDWNTSTGATCWVKDIVYTSTGIETQNPISGGCDHDNSTYLGVGRTSAVGYSETSPFYVVAQLAKPITVSDVELVWGNGYPMHYEVYALASTPENWSDGLAAMLTDGKRLYSKENPVVSYEPFFNTTSELQTKGNQSGDTQYVVLKMWEPTGSTFGFKLDEIHVGAYDDNYDTADHISTNNFFFRTEKYNAQTLNPTVRNNRNAILSGKRVTSVNYGIADVDANYVNVERIDDATKVWASKPGSYTLTVTGSADGETVPNSSATLLVLNRDWRGENTNTKSVIQDLDAANFSAVSSESSEYTIGNIRDGNESTRWSSGSSEASATNQYITIKLSDKDEYKMSDLEFLWERAYPATYAVYGLTSEPADMADFSYDTYKTNYNGRLLYEATLPKGIEGFPFHDLHTLDAGQVTELNDTKYIVVAFKEPIEQLNGDKYGVSLWELYAQATDMTQLNQTQKIDVADKTMYLNTQDAFAVQAQKTDGTVMNDHLTGVAFASAAATGKALATTVAYNESSNIYTVSATIDGTVGIKVAEIWDAGNNTYAIKTGNNRKIANKTYNITADYTNEGIKLSKTFTLQIFKKPMNLTTSSTETNLVFDDGYYVESRLEKYASPKVLSVDMTNVDFDTDYNGSSLIAASIPAPRFLNVANGGGLKGQATTIIGRNLDGTDMTETISTREKMNPNAVYYVCQDAFSSSTALKPETERVHGENVALHDNSTSSTGHWYIHELRLFEGYDYAPNSPTVNPTALTAHYGIFYTNLPLNRKTTIALPFKIRLKGTEAKGITFYEPTEYNASTSELSLTKQTGESLEAAYTYVIDSNNAANYSKTGGYAVALASYPYKSETATDNVEVKMKAQPKLIAIKGFTENAVIEGSFINSTVADGNAEYDYYLYAPGAEVFGKAGDEWFNYLWHPDHAEGSFSGKDCRYKVLPFYSYLKIPKSLHAQAKIAWFINDGVSTAILSHSVDKSLKPYMGNPMYDLMGRRIDSTYHGIIIQNGKKLFKR